ncbi:MAG: hypothetical protein ABGX12_07570 [Desulfurobacteriaceae bacterium]
MRFLKVLKKVKERELKEEKEKLLKIKEKLQTLEEELKRVENEKLKLESHELSDPLQLTLRSVCLENLRKKKQQLKGMIKALRKAEELQKEKVSSVNSYLKLIEKQERRIKVESEKRENHLTERFVNEVLLHRSPDSGLNL